MDRKDLDVTLYLVTDSSYHTEESLLRTVEEACKGGVTLVQLREKNKGGREYLDKAFKVKEITDRYNVPLIIDDRVDVELACDAAGVHVGASEGVRSRRLMSMIRNMRIFMGRQQESPEIRVIFMTILR